MALTPTCVHVSNNYVHRLDTYIVLFFAGLLDSPVPGMRNANIVIKETVQA